MRGDGCPGIFNSFPGEGRIDEFHVEVLKFQITGPDHEELRGGLMTPCKVSDVSVFKLLSLMPWISLSFLTFYFEVCVLIGPYLSPRVSQLN